MKLAAIKDKWTRAARMFEKAAVVSDKDRMPQQAAKERMVACAYRVCLADMETLNRPPPKQRQIRLSDTLGEGFVRRDPA